MPHSDRSAWEAVLANGEKVTINDHVYVAPPWSERDGAPYSIARVIEFVPASAARQNHGARRAKSHEKHARLALFYRPSEISGRASGDHRLLYAAIHSEVHPVSWLRGKCYVRHRDKIENMWDWKKKSDHFHYTKLFDPYIKREYEMLRTATVNNIPADIKAILVSRYEFLVTEKEMVADLLDGFRTCRTCEQWASSQDSVRCDACKSYYHMACVNPPLIAKPAKGYSWVCLPCAHRRAGLSPALSNGSNAVTVGRSANGKSKGKEKEKWVEPAYDKPDAFYRGWNFRYFGQHTIAEDTVDPDDPIFPRNATRVGIKYQANVPSWEERHLEQIESIEPDDPQEQIYERGTDEPNAAGVRTSEMMSKPDEDVVPFMVTIRAQPLPIPPYDIEVYDRALYLLLKFGFVDALRKMQQSTRKDFRQIDDLQGPDLAIFEREVARWGFLEHHETARLTHRKPSEIVRFYYKWRNEKLGAEHEATKQAKIVARASKKKIQKAQIAAQHKLQPHMPMGVSASVMQPRDASPDSDAEGSVWGENELDPEKPPSCAVCAAKVAKHWWKAPRSLTGNHLCYSCGSSYRKYGIAIPQKYAVEETLRSKKRDGTPMGQPTGKKIKLASGQASAAETPPPALPPPPPPKPAPCVLCRRTDKEKLMARCKNCSFSIHAGCYGVPKTDITPDWMCEPCANERSLDAQINPTCVLCPKKLPKMSRPPKKSGATYDFDFLHAMKPTEGYKWAHILCSIFVPEVMYTEANRLRVAEGISALPLRRWQQSCHICKQGGGAVIECGECQKPVHAACAWVANYTFGFELVLTSNKSKRADAVPVIEYGGETRTIVPQCFCPNHSFGEDRIILDMNQTEPQSGDTALQMYAASYKQVPIGDTFGLLRKAERLEGLMTPSTDDETTKASEALPTGCSQCGVDFSPVWHDAPKSTLSGWVPPVNGTNGHAEGGVKLEDAPAPTKICHQCHFKKIEA